MAIKIVDNVRKTLKTDRKGQNMWVIDPTNWCDGLMSELYDFAFMTSQVDLVCRLFPFFRFLVSSPKHPTTIPHRKST